MVDTESEPVPAEEAAPEPAPAAEETPATEETPVEEPAPVDASVAAEVAAAAAIVEEKFNKEGSLEAPVRLGRGAVQSLHSYCLNLSIGQNLTVSIGSHIESSTYFTKFLNAYITNLTRTSTLTHSCRTVTLIVTLTVTLSVTLNVTLSVTPTVTPTDIFISVGSLQ